jgi:hypothetical protein
MWGGGMGRQSNRSFWRLLLLLLPVLRLLLIASRCWDRSLSQHTHQSAVHSATHTGCATQPLPALWPALPLAQHHTWGLMTCARASRCHKGLNIHPTRPP